MTGSHKESSVFRKEYDKLQKELTEQSGELDVSEIYLQNRRWNVLAQYDESRAKPDEHDKAKKLCIDMIERINHLLLLEGPKSYASAAEKKQDKDIRIKLRELLTNATLLKEKFDLPLDKIVYLTAKLHQGGVTEEQKKEGSDLLAKLEDHNIKVSKVLAARGWVKQDPKKEGIRALFTVPVRVSSTLGKTLTMAGVDMKEQAQTQPQSQKPRSHLELILLVPSNIINAFKKVLSLDKVVEHEPNKPRQNRRKSL